MSAHSCVYDTFNIPWQQKVTMGFLSFEEVLLDILGWMLFDEITKLAEALDTMFVLAEVDNKRILLLQNDSQVLFETSDGGGGIWLSRCM